MNSEPSDNVDAGSGPESSAAGPTGAAVPVVEVAAGLVFHDGRLLITQRPQGSHLQGLWEFPGGKREADETWEACLRRELEEELGVGVEVGDLFDEVVHPYPGKTVHLRFFRCRLSRGEPRPLGCAAVSWVTRDGLVDHEFPPADAQLIDRLRATDGLWASSAASA